MPLKTSASTPLLGSLVGGDAEASTPLRRLHLRPFSSALGSRKVRSETDLQILDKDKGLRSSVHHKKSAPLKSMCIYREPRQFSSMRGGAHGSETKVRDLGVDPMYLGGDGGFTRQGGSAGGRNDEYSHSNGGVLAMYAKLVWEVGNDPERAEIYFDRAVQAAPDDCYVMASHAHFLWSTEEEWEEAIVD